MTEAKAPKLGRGPSKTPAPNRRAAAARKARAKARALKKAGLPPAEKIGHAPPHVPTKDQRTMVEILSGFGIPQDSICRAIGVSKPTLHRHYQEEIQSGAAKVEATMVGNLVRLSKRNDGTALKATMFTLETRFGWSKYVPAPPPKPEAAPDAGEPDEEKLGKKATADRDALSAHEGTPWSRLVN